MGEQGKKLTKLKSFLSVMSAIRDIKQIKANKNGNHLTAIHRDYVYFVTHFLFKTLGVCGMDLKQTANC